MKYEVITDPPISDEAKEEVRKSLAADNKRLVTAVQVRDLLSRSGFTKDAEEIERLINNNVLYIETQ